MRKIIALVVVGIVSIGPSALPAQDDVETQLLERYYQDARKEMVAQIEADFVRASDTLGRSELNPRVLWALKRVPRHQFVPDYLRNYAYENRPLPIGHDQTISQPFIVAVMTELLDLGKGCKALDVGTGSGYQAAILAEICDQVYSIEIVEPLGIEARERLERLGYNNVTVRIGDGFNGWPEQGPFDAIVVAAVAGELPQPLLAQVKPGGRMIIPIGDALQGQTLVVVEKDADGAITTRDLLPVLFVPLTRDSE
jgi:protein-L-isoaspartate(D-aspartate) O-methyltransferase